MGKKILQTITGPWVIRWSFHCILILLLAVIVTAAIYQSRDNTSLRLHTNEHQHHHKTNPKPKPEPEASPSPSPSPSPTASASASASLLSSQQQCDLFSGQWVFDNKSYPLYKDRDCSLMFGDLACETYGRKDLNYQFWRWQPHACDLPRFDGKALLERLKGKRLVFVGDSLNRNQWVSMLCLVETSMPEGIKFSKNFRGPLYTFTAKEYNVSIEFYWAPMLVESNGDDPSNHQVWNRMVRLNAIEKHARQWIDADILVFNSYQWWRMPTLKVLKEGSFESGGYKEVKYLRCYKMALNTWSNWLDRHVNRTRTKMFWVSMSSTHSRSEDWGMPGNRKCINETEMISKNGYWGSESDPKMMHVTEAAISRLKTRGVEVQMLNITQLSEYRKEAHPSIYKKLWRPLTKEQLADPRNYADCTHWCLPGVPDVWNEILYAYIMHS